MRWLVRRRIRLESLKVIDGQWFTRRMDGVKLLGLNISLLRDVSFHNCNIGDKEVTSIANNCPLLSEICLNDCDRVTDASIVALAKCSVQLIRIDIGKCTNITDDGLTAFASGCSNVMTTNLLDGLDVYHLRRISFHGCSRITDIGISAIACTFRLLNTIDIPDCSQITDVGISAIADNCPELHTNICDLPDVTRTY